MALASDSGQKDSAVVEAALMAGRQLIHFLGLDIEFKGGRRPVITDKKRTRYHSYTKGEARCTDEVKIANLGGDFQRSCKLGEVETEILAEFLPAANRSTAHLTEGSGHRLWEEDGKVFYEGCEIIRRRVMAACSIAEARLAV